MFTHAQNASNRQLDFGNRDIWIKYCFNVQYVDMHFIVQSTETHAFLRTHELYSDVITARHVEISTGICLQ
jgi:hypothetical protein